MGSNSAISWTTHTLNPWIGCSKVSPGCANCYAERDWDKRRGRVIWGPQGTRSKTKMLDSVAGWNAAAKKAGVRHRVFCASLADVFEDYTSAEGSKPLDAWRAELWPVIEKATNLDFLLLTKRPENIRRMVPPRWLAYPGRVMTRYAGQEEQAWPSHVWVGTSVENQETADQRIPHLLAVPAKVRFLSVEPMLGEVGVHWHRWIHWIICGSESGATRRPFDPAWARYLRDQAAEMGAAFFVKQLPSGGAKPLTDPATFPEDLRMQEVPHG